MSLSDHEQNEFSAMVTACGRSPGDFQVTLDKTSSRLIIENRRLGKRKEYSRDEQSRWILDFATDLKTGEL